MATTTATRTVQVALDSSNPSNLADAVSSAGLAQTLSDLSSMTEETVTAASSSITLTKLPIGPVLLATSSDVMLTQGTNSTVADGGFLVNYSTGVITTHSDEASAANMKVKYLGLTKAADGTGSKLGDALAATFGK